MDKIKVSVIIITGNEEKNIRECIQSVEWADDIVVVDCFSEDRTIEILKELPVRFYQRKWEGYANQKAYALSLAENEWVLSLDADERATMELKEEMENILKNNSQYDGFYIPRKNFFMGKWIKSCGWYPGYQLRFFRKKLTKLTPRKVHEGFDVNGKIGYLKSDILHYTFPDFQFVFKKINEYSSLQAEEKAEKIRSNIFKIIFNPIYAFLHHFILRKGFTDGIYGFFVSLIHALTKLMMYLKIWEIQKQKK
jgi:glycosyltransferase involved in cell wall biosynthesis